MADSRGNRRQRKNDDRARGRDRPGGQRPRQSHPRPWLPDPPEASFSSHSIPSFLGPPWPIYSHPGNPRYGSDVPTPHHEFRGRSIYGLQSFPASVPSDHAARMPRGNPRRRSDRRRDRPRQQNRSMDSDLSHDSEMAGSYGQNGASLVRHFSHKYEWTADYAIYQDVRMADDGGHQDSMMVDDDSYQDSMMVDNDSYQNRDKLRRQNKTRTGGRGRWDNRISYDASESDTRTEEDFLERDRTASESSQQSTSMAGSLSQRDTHTADDHSQKGQSKTNMPAGYSEGRGSKTEDYPRQSDRRVAGYHGQKDGMCTDNSGQPDRRMAGQRISDKKRVRFDDHGLKNENTPSDPSQMDELMAGEHDPKNRRIADDYGQSRKRTVGDLSPADIMMASGSSSKKTKNSDDPSPEHRTIADDHSQNDREVTEDPSVQSRGIECDTSQQGTHNREIECDASQQETHNRGIECDTSQQGTHNRGIECDTSQQGTHNRGIECDASQQETHNRGIECDTSQQGTHNRGIECDAGQQGTQTTVHYSQQDTTTGGSPNQQGTGMGNASQPNFNQPVQNPAGPHNPADQMKPGEQGVFMPDGSWVPKGSLEYYKNYQQEIEARRLQNMQRIAESSQNFTRPPPPLPYRYPGLLGVITQPVPIPYPVPYVPAAAPKPATPVQQQVSVGTQTLADSSTQTEDTDTQSSLNQFAQLPPDSQQAQCDIQPGNQEDNSHVQSSSNQCVQTTSIQQEHCDTRSGDKQGNSNARSWSHQSVQTSSSQQPSLSPETKPPVHITDIGVVQTCCSQQPSLPSETKPPVHLIDSGDVQTSSSQQPSLPSETKRPVHLTDIGVQADIYQHKQPPRSRQRDRRIRSYNSSDSHKSGARQNKKPSQRQFKREKVSEPCYNQQQPNPTPTDKVYDAHELTRPFGNQYGDGAVPDPEQPVQDPNNQLVTILLWLDRPPVYCVDDFCQAVRCRAHRQASMRCTACLWEEQEDSDEYDQRQGQKDQGACLPNNRCLAVDELNDQQPQEPSSPTHIPEVYVLTAQCRQVAADQNPCPDCLWDPIHVSFLHLHDLTLSTAKGIFTTWDLRQSQLNLPHKHTDFPQQPPEQHHQQQQQQPVKAKEDAEVQSCTISQSTSTVQPSGAEGGREAQFMSISESTGAHQRSGTEQGAEAQSHSVSESTGTNEPISAQQGEKSQSHSISESTNMLPALKAQQEVPQPPPTSQGNSNTGAFKNFLTQLQSMDIIQSNASGESQQSLLPTPVVPDLPLHFDAQLQQWVVRSREGKETAEETEASLRAEETAPPSDEQKQLREDSNPKSSNIRHPEKALVCPRYIKDDTLQHWVCDIKPGQPVRGFGCPCCNLSSNGWMCSYGSNNP